MKAYILSSVLLLASTTWLFSQNISFNQTPLDFKDFPTVDFGTSLKFGPDERLYVAQLKGEIKIYTVFKGGPNSYEVVGEETLLEVKTIPNFDDTGQPAFDNRGSRQITGITVVGTPANPIIYVSSSDPKWGGPSGDKLLDTNSGIITRLTWTGTEWETIDIVRGLPRSEENHSTNAVEYTEIGGKPYLLVASGGLTNAGAPSKNFAYITEYALSAAILSVDLDAINTLQVKTDPSSGRLFVYDIPTLDDPTRPNKNGIYDINNPNYDGIDVNDPFGGNDGLNMAMVVEGGPVQIFSPGFRNSYALVVTESGRVYATENGANINWGGLPVGEGDPSLVSNDYNPNEPGNGPLNPSSSGEYVDNKDHLLMITDNLENYEFGSFYGGHPTPIRANPGSAYVQGMPFPYNPGGAGLYTKFVGDDNDWSNVTPLFTPTDMFRTQILAPVAPGGNEFQTYAANSLPANWPPVPLSMANPAEADFIAPTLENPNGPQPNIITIFPNNTNALEEYKSSNFDGAIKGALIAGKSGGTIHLITLNEDGSLKNLEINKWNMNGGNALGLTSNSDNQIFPGTIWVATFDNRIMVMTPEDDVFCVEIDDPLFDPLADYDNDGYTNQDEIDNGTDYCSGASRPDDYDQDFVSDLNDLDDDGDGIIDAEDPFQLGDPRDLPIENELFTNQIDDSGRQSGFLGLGLTGFMNNGEPNPNWMNWIDRERVRPGPNDIFGGTAGAIQVSMTGGTANGTANNQEKGFQFGANVGTESGEYVISSGIIGLASPGQLFDYDGYGEVGIQMGDGTQSNFIKMVFTKTHILAVQEINDVPLADSLTMLIPADSLLGPNTLIQLSFEVDPEVGVVKPFYKLDNGEHVYLGSIEAQGVIKEAIQNISKPLAIGVYGSSHDFSKSFIGVWNYFMVKGERPFIIRNLGNVERLMNDPNLVINLSQYFDDNNGVQNLVFTVSENTDQKVGTTIEGSTLTIDFPNDEANSTVTVKATDVDGFSIEQSFLVNVEQDREIILRINTAGPLLPVSDGTPNWLDNSLNGPFSNEIYSVNTGRGYTNTFPSADRHSSIPSYISNETYSTLFSRERFSTDPEMTYSIPLPNGDYIVNLYMGNGFDGTSTQFARLFDIDIEGNNVESQFDLISEFGHKVGGMKSYPISLTDEELNITFRKIKENPIINGIEIIGKPIQTPIHFEPLESMIHFAGHELDGSLFVVASGGDGNLRYSATGLPPGVQIEPTNGTIYGQIAENALSNSPYRVRLTIDDEDEVTSDAVYFNFTWTISPPLENQTWKGKNESQLYSGRHENSFVQAGNRFYLMGGRESSTTIDIYDYENDVWESLKNISPKQFNHFQAIEYEGLIWVIGAFQTNNFPNEEPTENIWIFDPANKVWIEGPEIPESRRRGGAGLVMFRDKFYLVNGNRLGHKEGYVNYMDEYDPKTGEWKILPNSPRARDHFFATTVGSKLFVAGGRRTGGPGGTFAPVIPEVDVYDFQQNTWTTLPGNQNLPTPRAGAITNNYLGKLIVAGGEIAGYTDALNVTEMYDPETSEWKTLAPLNNARHGTQGIVSGKGLFVLAGSPKRGGGNQKNMEYFGFDEPFGKPVIGSEIVMESSLEVKKAVTSKTTIAVENGNSAIFVKSIEIVGEDAESFVFVTDNILSNTLWKSGHIEPIEIDYIGSKVDGRADLVVTFGNGQTKIMNLIGDGIYEQVSLFVNSGSSSNVSYEGTEYISDINLTENLSFTTSKGYTNSQAGTEPLFHSERYGTNFSYSIAVPNGVYDLTTYHNETWFGRPNGGVEGPGKRVYNISIQGELAKSNIDLFTISENEPTSFEFENIVVTNGTLLISLDALTNNASISGFKLANKGELGQVTLAMISTSTISGRAPLVVEFNGDESGGEQPLAFLWEFGDGGTSVEVNPTYTFNEPGIFEARLTVTDGNGQVDTQSVVISVADRLPDFGLYLNSGTPNTVTLEENSHQGDSGFPSYYSTSRTNLFVDNSVNALYHTERFGQNFEFAIPVPNGIYNVKTYHNELWFGKYGPASKAGNRIFDLFLEGVPVKQNLDLFVESGDRPLMLSFENVLVSDGILNLKLASIINNATISGISIVSVNDTDLLRSIIEASTQEGVAPLAVQFNGDNSIGQDISSFVWNFGDGTGASGVNTSKTYNSPGEYTVTLTVMNQNENSDSSSFVINVLESDPLVSYHYNAGTNNTTVWNNINYEGDNLTPSIFNSGTRTYSLASASSIALFQTERFWTNLAYSIPVENGIYTVKTYHNELWFGKYGPAGAPGMRVYDISIEGQLLKENFDIFIEGNNSPTELVFEEIIVTDGVLNLNLDRKINNANISGFSIIQTARLESNQRIQISTPKVTVNKLEVVSNNSYAEGVVMYPNPTQDVVNINLPFDLNTTNILISDLTGRLVQNYSTGETLTGNIQLNLEKLKSGVYTVHLVFESGETQRLRLMIKK